jgi:hypothetical protein
MQRSTQPLSLVPLALSISTILDKCSPLSATSNPLPPQSSLSHFRYGKLAVKFAKNTNKIETKIYTLGRLIRQEKQQVISSIL